MTVQAKRRTQAERSAEMRSVLVETAIRLLHRNGYAATTTILVAKEAGVSRGAMLHHFGTKVDLMAEVVRSVYENEVEQYRKLLLPITDLEERRRAMPDVVWRVLSRPSGVAVLEILQGSRSDPVLGERLALIQAQIERDALLSLQSLFGITTTKAMMRLIVWAARGLSIAQILAPDPEKIPESIDLLRQLLDAWHKSGAAAPEPPINPESCLADFG